MNNIKQTQDDKTIQPFNCSTIQRVKAYAFTLAETLIVIGIIGVVAALTLPNLNHATGDKERVTRVKKIYSAINDAFDRAQAIYGDFDTWFNDFDCNNDNAACAERFAKRVTEFMKVSKDCEFEAGCFSSSALFDFWGNEVEENDLESLKGYMDYMVMLSDGTSLAFAGQIFSFGHCINIDIDGPNKGKNQDGYDRFHFWCDKNIGCVPYDFCNKEDYFNYNFTYDSGYVYPEQWILQNDNADYLKCPDDLHWTEKTSCQ